MSVNTESKPNFPFVQIRFILLQNRQGKTRLSRWYVAYNDEERQKIEIETHRAIVNRDKGTSSFLEVSKSPPNFLICFVSLGAV